MLLVRPQTMMNLSGRAVQPLIKAAEDPRLREAALDALRMLAHESAWDALSGALADPAQINRETAVKGLAAIFIKSTGRPGLSERLRAVAGPEGARSYAPASPR